MLLAEIRAGLPAIAGAGGRFIEKEEELVEKRNRLASLILGVLDAMKKRGKTWNF